MQTLPYVYLFAPACTVILILIWREAARQGFSGDRVAAAMAACAAGAVIGSKVLMFDFHTPAYGEKTFLGAVVGGMLTLAIVVKALEFDARAFDVPVLPVLWGAALGRIGCFVSGCCHGIPTTLPWGVRYAHMSDAVHPTQLYESALDIILALALIRVRGRFRHPGSLALAGAVGIAFIRFVVDPMRATAAWSVGLTIVQWTTLAVIVVAGVALFIRERAAPKRVHLLPPPSSLFPPAAVLASVAAIGALTHSWLTPIEIALISTVTFTAAFVVFQRLVPRMLLSSPIVGAAVLIPLQVQDPRPDTVLTRSYLAFGGGAMGGGYEVTTEDCEGNTLTRTQHTYKVAGASAELRQDKGRGTGSGFRLTAFRGSDRAPAATRVSGSPAPIDTARNDRIGGMTAAATFDWRYVGLTAGFAAGRWGYSPDQPLFEPPRQSHPIGGLRLGRRTGLHGEIAAGTHFPAPAPEPAFRVGLAFGDSLERSTFRVGIGHGGVYAGARMLNKDGFEFEPFASFGSPTQRQIGMSVKKRFYLSPR